MIYCLAPELYPDKDKYIEELTYRDKNDFEWRIARIKDGFMVKFCGDMYFKDTTFNGVLSTGKIFQIKNTNCIFFQNNDFEIFCDVRDVITGGWTDDIWELMTEFFAERLNVNNELIESEIPWK